METLETERDLIKARLAFLKDKYVKKFIKESKPKLKNRIASEKARVGGNKLFYRQDHDHKLSWQKYSSSIALAPKGSEELALAYANRSALLYHMSLYQDCVIDVDRAVHLTKSSFFKVKWLGRKYKCLQALDDLPNAVKTMQEIRSNLDNIDDEGKKGLAMDCIKELDQISCKKSDNAAQKSSQNVQERVNDFSNLALKYNSKYKKHLVADRNIATGEIIFVEKPYYASTFHFQVAQPTCSHCYATCLTTLPCDTCTWSMYCSEKCKNDAWSEYHGIECQVLGDNVAEPYTQIVLHTVIMECRKNGGIDGLKKYLQKIDREKENLSKNLIVDGKLSVGEFEVIYALSKRKFIYSDVLVGMTLRVLISLAVNTTFFGKKFSTSDCRDIADNEDMIFIGSLFMKLLVTNKNPVLLPKDLSSLIDEISANRAPNRGNCMSAVYSLLNHNCNPNADVFIDSNKNVVLFALQPIKKNEQIFISYPNYYITYPKEGREGVLSLNGINCDCKACKGNWPSSYIDLSIALENDDTGSFLSVMFDKPLALELFVKHQAEIMNTATYILDPSAKDLKFHYTECTKSDLAHSIDLASKKFPEPYPITGILIHAFNTVVQSLYGEGHQFPSKCINKI